MPLHPEVLAHLERQKGLPPRSSLTVAETRAAYRRAAVLAGEPPEVAHVRDAALPSGVPVRVYRPADDAPGTVVYFHGGRFFSGDLETHDAVCRSLAVASGCEVVAVDYRLAPEHPFPAAVEDADEAVKWAAERSRLVAVAGDSAGGNLAAAAALVASDSGGPELACQVLVYPMLDPACSFPSHREFAEGYGPGSADMLRGWREYLATPGDCSDPYACPLRATTLHGLPPALVITAEYDTLRDEGEEYARRLPGTVLRRYDGMVHGFFQFGGVISAGREAIAAAGAFLRQHLAARP